MLLRVLCGRKELVAQGIKSFFLTGTAGRLEALLNQGKPEATHAALVCHPHPLYGGTVHNKVVYHAMKTLHGFGFPVLRFNFRGAGLSEGEHDQGHGEVDDVRTGMDWLESEYRLPIIFCGFSFGAATGLRAVCGDPRVAGLISLGTPVAVEGRIYTYDFLRKCPMPKLFVSGSRDQYSPRPNLEKLVEMAPAPKELVIVEGGDHFFEGHLAEMQTAIRNWTARFFRAQEQVEAS
ncbi:MAG TPA: alpha/beta family hydrolase [Candidatus Angelobacter sp.]|nr:alpha/beta family hydrolase [Candidatus Angelobacter sp.]